LAVAANLKKTVSPVKAGVRKISQNLVCGCCLNDHVGLFHVVYH